MDEKIQPEQPNFKEGIVCKQKSKLNNKNNTSLVLYFSETLIK
jgi:hypothetical protein